MQRSGEYANWKWHKQQEQTAKNIPTATLVFWK